VTDLIDELRTLLVEALKLGEREEWRGIRPQDIDPDVPIFVEGLGLDSIDAYGFAVAIADHYNVLLPEEPEDIERLSIRSLAEIILGDSQPPG
jgi:acyl carrier protein